jgi:pimeloyl-ACP methyl ester carboxylesterase
MTTVHSSDGTAIAFDVTGDGPAVVLVGGMFQHRAIDQATAQLAALLAERFTVFHYDRRGRGDSSDTEPYSVEREVEDVAAIVETVGSASLFGMSSGAFLALEAARAGVPVDALALYEPPVDGNPNLPANWDRELIALVGNGTPGAAVERFMTEAVGMPAEVVAGMKQSPAWPLFVAVEKTMPYDLALTTQAVAGGPDRWAEVATPALVMAGGDSTPNWHAGAQGIAGALPHARYRTLPGQTHMVAPDALAPVLLDFFSEVPR